MVEVQIENSVTMVTVQHHEACRLMPNSYPEWGNFQSTPSNHYGFSCILFLQKLHLSLNMRYFINFVKFNNFFYKKKFDLSPIDDTDLTFGSKWCEKNSQTSKRYPESILHHLSVHLRCTGRINPSVCVVHYFLPGCRCSRYMAVCCLGFPVL